MIRQPKVLDFEREDGFFKPYHVAVRVYPTDTVDFQLLGVIEGLNPFDVKNVSTFENESPAQTGGSTRLVPPVSGEWSCGSALL